MSQELATTRAELLLAWMKEHKDFLSEEILTIELHMNKERIVPKVVLHPKPIGTK